MFKFLASTVFILFPIIASADFISRISTGVFVAPYLGQVVNGSMASSPSSPPNVGEPGEMKYDFSGQRFGLQLGLMLGNWVLGADLSQGEFDYQFSSPSGASVPDSKIKISQGTAIIMYRGFKIVPWLGFVVTGHGRDKKQSIDYSSPGGIQGGIGFKLYRWLQLNIEGRAYSFTKLKRNGEENSLPHDGREKFNASEFLIGLSIPLEFGISNKK